MIEYPLYKGGAKASLIIEGVIIRETAEIEFVLELTSKGDFRIRHFEINNKDEVFSKTVFPLLFKCDCCGEEFQLVVFFEDWRHRRLEWMGGGEMYFNFKGVKAKIRDLNFKQREQIIKKNLGSNIKISAKNFEDTARQMLQLRNYLREGPPLKDIGIRTRRHSFSKTIDVCSGCMQKFLPEISCAKMMEILPLRVKGEYRDYWEEIKEEKVACFVERS